ncbi:MAG: phospholipase D-like domain-containing protein [Deltaproteobacteria bacterium]|nr:phospholipase D-like domain-containing protein [Deltaproteobacteria bacterium]
MTAGNRATLLVDGASAYPSMLDAIFAATSTILMDSYIFNDDSAGRAFANALASAARRGVSTWLIRDGAGTWSVDRAFFRKLKEAGVHVLEYRPIAPWRRGFGLLRRNHRKLLVVDGRVGFAGGMNVGGEWLPREDGGQGWHDIHVRIEGPAAQDLSRLALATWKSHGNVDLDRRLFLPEAVSAGEEHVNVVGSGEIKMRRAIRESYLHAIRRAERYIYIANAYFVPDRGFRRALRNACARGVDVRVMVPAKGDILPVRMASQALYGRLLRAGVRIFLWKREVLHAKTAVIDGEWATVGSFNIDHRSWTMNLEVNVDVVGARFSDGLRKVFESDETHCSELSREDWARRPFLQRVVERFFRLFRRWM